MRTRTSTDTRSPGVSRVRGVSIEFGPAWSPDGNEIAYVRFVNGDPNQRTVYVMNADGSDQHAVHPGPGFQVVPAWQPRGQRIDH